MNFLDELLGRGGLKRAEGTLGQIPGILKESLDPYIRRGEEQYGDLSQKYGEMSRDPVAFLESLMSGYQPSESFQRRRDEALRAAGNTAAAGGMRGSLGDQTAQFQLANQLMGDDMQQWLQNVLGVQGAGLGGQQGIYNLGAQSASALGSDLANVMGSKAQLQAQDKGPLGNLMNVLGLGAGSALGGQLGKWMMG